MSRPVTMSENNPSSNSSSEEPSMVGSHIKYAQGVASTALGYETGEQTKKEAVEEMRAAKDAKDGAPTQSTVLGTVENLAGKVTGCEGMENEGESRKATGPGAEETSGTG